MSDLAYEFDAELQLILVNKTIQQARRIAELERELLLAKQEARRWKLGCDELDNVINSLRETNTALVQDKKNLTTHVRGLLSERGKGRS